MWYVIYPFFASPQHVFFLVNDETGNRKLLEQIMMRPSCNKSHKQTAIGEYAYQAAVLRYSTMPLSRKLDKKSIILMMYRWQRLISRRWLTNGFISERIKPPSRKNSSSDQLLFSLASGLLSSSLKWNKIHNETKFASRCSAPAVWNSLPKTVLSNDCYSF